MKAFFSNLLLAVLIIMLCTGSLALLGNMVGIGDYTILGKSDRNSNNILSPDDYTFKSGDTFNGITVTYDDDGVLTLNGVATEYTKICLGKYYILEDNYYTMSCETSSQARITTGSKISYSDASGAEKEMASGSLADVYTFSNSKLQYVKVYITIEEGDAFEAYKIAPILVTGKTAEPFYVHKENEL